MKFALDTNIYIDSFRDPVAAAALLRFLERALPFTFLSAVVMQELAAGARTPARVRELPDLLGPDLHAGGRVDDDDRRVDGRERFDDIGLEVGVARRVDDRDPDAIVLEGTDGEIDRLRPLVLVGVPVERGGARLDGAQA